MAPSSVILTALGSALLWFGWFGFNAGSEFGADGVAGSTFLMTNFAAAAAAVTWIILDYIKFGKPTLLGVATGAVAGLVAITPAAGFVGIVGALVIGFLRKDVAVGMLFPLNLSFKQSVVASVVLAMYFPCVATFVVLLRELGAKELIKASCIMITVAMLVGSLLNFILGVGGFS
jgi:ammonia channel protein AmtB